jgi:hypothetical protein
MYHLLKKPGRVASEIRMFFWLVPTESRLQPGRFPWPAKSRELRSPGALTPSAGRSKPPRQLTALGCPPPRRLTRRLSLRSTSLHYAAANGPLLWLPASLRSVALHETAETGEPPASASPALALETLASSLASAVARSCAGPLYRRAHRIKPRPGHPLHPQGRARLLCGRHGNAHPHDPEQVVSTEGPRRCESGQLLLRLRCSFLRVWAYAELSALTAASIPVSPLAVRVPRWAYGSPFHP